MCVCVCVCVCVCACVWVGVYTALFRLFCIFVKAFAPQLADQSGAALTGSGNPIVRSLLVGVAHGEAAPGTPLHAALVAAFGADHILCRAQVAGAEPWRITPSAAAAAVGADTDAAGGSDGGAAGGQNIIQRFAAALRSQYSRQAATAAQPSSAGTSAGGAASSAPVLSLAAYGSTLLKEVYWAVAQYAQLPANWAHPAGWTPTVNRSPAAAAAAAEVAASAVLAAQQTLSMHLDPTHMQVGGFVTPCIVSPCKYTWLRLLHAYPTLHAPGFYTVVFGLCCFTGIRRAVGQEVQSHASNREDRRSHGQYRYQ